MADLVFHGFIFDIVSLTTHEKVTLPDKDLEATTNKTRQDSCCTY